jgi:hypothetical protein
MLWGGYMDSMCQKPLLWFVVKRGSGTERLGLKVRLLETTLESINFSFLAGPLNTR